MKDITHYFPDTVKPCDISPSDSKSNVKLQDEVEYTSTKKRARVKIKISRVNSKNSVCNIVECKNDLIDKTPSPFTKESKRSKEFTRNKTHKKSSETLNIDLSKIQKEDISEKKEQQILKEVNLNHVLIELDSEPEVIEHNINEELSLKKSLDKHYSNEDKMERNLRSHDKIKGNIANTSNTEINKDWAEMDVYELDSEHKESNAFHVLMNRNKTNDVSPVHSLLENDVLTESVKNEPKEKLKDYKEKLIALADKKGYSKRKLKEMEEGEKIEAIIRKRMKLFTGGTKINDNNSTILNEQKNISNNLLHFFRAPVKEEDTEKVSTIVVKADVHMEDISAVHSLTNTPTGPTNLKNKIITNISQTELLNTNNIDLITLEDVKHHSGIQENSQSLLQHNDKPKWSLRIKLQSLKDNTDEETTFSPRSKGKFNVEQKKQNEKLHNSSEKKEKINGQESKSNKKSIFVNNAMQKDIEEDIIIEEEIYNKNNKKQLIADIGNEGKHRNCNNNKIDIIKTNNSENPFTVCDHILKEKSHKKLAPLFTKQLKQNTAIVAARRMFLQSDTTNNESKNVEKKIIDSYITFLSFPKVSHVTQLIDEMQANDELNTYPIRMKKETKYTPILNYDNYKYTSEFVKMSNDSPVTVNISIKKNVEEVLTEMEKYCTGTKSMWTTISSIANNQPGTMQSQRTKGKKRKSTGKESMVQKNEESQIKNSIWTHKYKPTNSHQIVGNEEAALKLKDWLAKWTLTLSKEDASSGDEFSSSDCSYTSKISSNQVAVLLGPYGSGKTASVYAVAEELGYSVLEVNASSKRTGKKILKEYEEATKSHRLKKGEINSLPISILKNIKDLPQNSLILLEDIDLIFDEDEGFIVATNQLASNTKRPIVMTCRDVCSHLNKMAPEQNRIYFQKVVGNRVSTLLELISLAETGSRLSHECLAELLQNGDLRKALLQLQYLLVSGFTHASKNPFDLESSIWQDMRHYLYKPAIKVNKKQKAKSRVKIKSTNDTNVTDILNNLANNLDNLSLLPSLIKINDPALDITFPKIEASLSLSEDLTPYSFLQNISSDIAECIDQKVICRDHLIGKDKIQYQTSLNLKKQLNEGVNFALSQITSWTTDSRSLSLDYLPYIRTICRAEECRATSKSKRGNRFFHYLNGLKFPTSSLKPNILKAACKMLQEKPINETF